MGILMRGFNTRLGFALLSRDSSLIVKVGFVRRVVITTVIVSPICSSQSRSNAVRLRTTIPIMPLLNNY